MTKKQQYKVLEKDHAVPWMDIIEHELNVAFTEEIANQVFDNIIKTAWNFHNTVPPELRQEKTPDREDAVEILKNDPDVKAHVLITVGDDFNAILNLNGTGKQIMCLLVFGAAQFIHNSGNDAPEKYKSRVISLFKEEFIEALNAVLEDDDDD